MRVIRIWVAFPWHTAIFETVAPIVNYYDSQGVVAESLLNLLNNFHLGYTFILLLKSFIQKWISDGYWIAYTLLQTDCQWLMLSVDEKKNHHLLSFDLIPHTVLDLLLQKKVQVKFFQTNLIWIDYLSFKLGTIFLYLGNLGLVLYFQNNLA